MEIFLSYNLVCGLRWILVKQRQRYNKNGLRQLPNTFFVVYSSLSTHKWEVILKLHCNHKPIISCLLSFKKLILVFSIVHIDRVPTHWSVYYENAVLVLSE